MTYAQEPEPGSVYAKYSSIGLQFTLIIVAFCYAGNWLGGRFDLEPWGTLIGAILGFAGASIWLYREIYPESDSGTQSKAKRSSGRERGPADD